MKISEIKAKIDGNDILTIISDFLKLDGLSFSVINIDDDIEAEGNFKKIINLNFKGRVDLLGVQADKLFLRVKSIKVMKLRIFGFMKNFGVKVALRSLKKQGITVEKDIIIVDIGKIIKVVPFIKFNIKSMGIEERYVVLELNDIDIALNNIGQKVQEEVVEEKKDEIDLQRIEIQKVEDQYTKGRNHIEEKLPKKLRIYSDYVFMIPDIIAFMYRLLKDKRVNKKTKTALIASIMYVSLPIDILPDKIPFIGSIDDLGVIFFTLNRIINDVPIEVILENWQGKNEFVVVLKKSLEYLTKYTGAKNVDKLYDMINELVKV
ncbi:hypothetical protein CPJCM30710_01610 [Clostridium polyendosporum]|uniref:DUF1232 domain-containing protein n=1 Tax=Clostridium polyendosporum TaxID=69208 RepID=A0A919VEJ3_9CLOT|nr:DUF1232 domain-containing protein [Clostridium polyendosporum]GIM27495.1 hypothetical protein CPJCM30710_01610 [Clostridium polyendosporum]